MWPARGLGLVCFFAALAAATGSVTRGGVWARRVEQTLVTEQQQRSQLDSWCRREIAAQESQRLELKRLHDQVSSSLTSSEHLFSMSQQLEDLAATLKSRESEAVQAAAQQSHVNFTFEELQRDVRALGNVKSKLESKPGTFLQTRPLNAITGMLKSLHMEQERVLDKIAAPANLQSEASRLRAQFEQRSRDLAHERTRQQAAEASQELLLQAFSESDSFLADLQDLCKLGADVHDRFSAEIGPAIEKLGKDYDVEGYAPSAYRSSSVARTTTARTTTTTTTMTTTAATAIITPESVTDAEMTTHEIRTSTTRALATTIATTTTTVATTASITLSTTFSATSMTTSTAVKSRPAATMPLAESAPLDQDLDPAADDPLPATTTLKVHKRKKGKRTTPTTTAPDEDDDDDVSLTPARTTTVGATQNGATMSSEALEDNNLDDVTTPAPKHHHGRTTTPVVDMNEDDFDDAPLPPKKTKKLKVKQQAMPDTSGGLPGTYNAWAPSGGMNEMENAEKRAKAQAAGEIDKYKKELMGGDDDDDDDEPQPARRHTHHVDEVDDLGSGHSQKGLEGGWKALMKNGDTKKAKHTFKDESSGIMDLIQTPHTYTAWHPGVPANIKKAASNELQAAEKAFDADDVSFLQVATTRKTSQFAGLRSNELEASNAGGSSSSVNAASLVLEEYGSVLGSQPLVQLARSRISAARLRALWSKLVNADATPIGDQHEQTEVQWCKDFQHDSFVTAQRDRETRQKDMAEILKEETTSTVLRQQIAALRQLLQVISKDSEALRSLRATLQREWGSIGELLTQMEAAVDVENARFAAALRGTAAGAGAELSDMLDAALEHRVAAEASWRGKLAEAEAARTASETRRAALLKAVDAASDSQGVLKDRYRQMCGWALDDQEAREHHQASEKNAIRIALVVMGAL